MTREEAIKVIDNRFDIMDYCESARLEEALDIAIESLKQKEIITCKDCKFSHLSSDGECKWCEKWVDAGDLMIELYVGGDFYCGYAEKRLCRQGYISELKKAIQDALDVIQDGFLKIKDAGRRWKMGINYYVVKNGPSCQDPVHIGKASIGWMFSFQRQNEKWHEPPIVWNTFNQVKDWLKKYTVDSTDYVIIDEYDEIVSYDDFIEMVEWKQEHDKDNPDNFDYSDNVDGYRFTDSEFC